MKNEVLEKNLSLIIPAHNAEHILEESIKEYNTIFSHFDKFEIIIVCNACSDNTLEVSKKLAENYPVNIIDIPHRGKGNALIRGFRLAKYNTMGFLDVDNPFGSNQILDMINNLHEDVCDMSIATKYLKGSLKNKRGVQDSQLRRIIALGGQMFSRLFFNLRFRDTQAGAKFFKDSVWQSISRNLICVGFDFDIELLYKSKKRGFRIAEFYTPLIKYEKFSTVRVRYLAGMVYRLIKLRFFNRI